MGKKLHTRLITLVYLGLAVALTALLTTAQIQDFPHQIFGIALFVLVVCHLVLNRFWIRHSVSGRWNLHRICVTATVVALAFLVVAQGINCILLSSYFWPMLPESFAYFSASLHMCLGTWFFVIAAVHFGLNVNLLIGNRLHFARTKDGRLSLSAHNAGIAVVLVLLGVIGVYGIVAFVQLQMPQYMFMAQASEVAADANLAIRFLQYLCVGVALVEITHCLSAFAQQRVLHHRAKMAKGRVETGSSLA